MCTLCIRKRAVTNVPKAQPELPPPLPVISEAFFGTVPLGITMWGKLFALAFSVIVLSEVIKVFARLFQKKKA